jgi:hypothetical protein
MSSLYFLLSLAINSVLEFSTGQHGTVRCCSDEDECSGVFSFLLREKNTKSVVYLFLEK